ncbi:MAG: hypothetical protein RL285_1584 [Bacteroidota bacterium]
MPSPQITAIYIYPIKSMGGISLNEAKVGMRGLQHDRRYMLISADGRFLTQRQTPELGRFYLAYNADKSGFIVTFQGDTLAIPLSGYPIIAKSKRAWGERSHSLGRSCAGTRRPNTHQRMVFGEVAARGVFGVSAG